MTPNTVEDRESKPVPRNVWIPALVFTAACLILLFIAFFIGNLQPDQRKILNAIFSLLAGFATFFIGGTALIKLTGSLHGLKIAFTGTAGVAIFVFVLLHPIFTSGSIDPPGQISGQTPGQNPSEPEGKMGYVIVKLTCPEDQKRVYNGYITVRSTDGKNANNGEVFGDGAHFQLLYGDYKIHISNQAGIKDDQFSLHVPTLDLTYDCDDYQPKDAAQKRARDEALRGWWYETGQLDGGRDYVAAMRWYLKAVQDGDAEANWNIGRLYEFGFGVPPDLTKAKSWYQKAADKGVLQAEDSLANLGHNKAY